MLQDTCKAFLAVARSKNTVGETINSASNFEISIEKTALLISELMNHSIEIVSEENEKDLLLLKLIDFLGVIKRFFS